MKRGLFAAIFFAALALMAVLPCCNLMAQTSQPADTLDGSWKKITPNELKDNAFSLFGDDWMLLATGSRNEKNAMTISWGGLGVLWGRNVVTVYVSSSRYTYGLMEKNECFTVTAFPEEYREALNYMGTKSGRDEDKFKNSGLTAQYTPAGHPAFAQARLLIECRKIYSAPFDMNKIIPKDVQDMYNRHAMGIHTMYIGEILNVWVKNK